jgi:hypothetical protein
MFENELRSLETERQRLSQKIELLRKIGLELSWLPDAPQEADVVLIYYTGRSSGPRVDRLIKHRDRWRWQRGSSEWSALYEWGALIQRYIDSGDRISQVVVVKDGILSRYTRPVP